MGSEMMSTLGLVDKGSLLFTGKSLSVISLSFSPLKPDIFVESPILLAVGCLCHANSPTPHFLRVKDSNFFGSNDILLLLQNDEY